jgi:FlaA1/EpsC-like NDP-sugar epimerase
LASDALTLLLSVAAGLIFKWAIHGISDWEPYLRLWPFLFVFLAVYALMGLYSGSGAKSTRRTCNASQLSTALVFFTLAAATVSIRGGRSYFTWTTLIAALVSVILLPLNRAIVRRRFATEPWWGAPAVVIGAGPAGNRAVRAMLAEPGLGLKPIAVLDEEFEGARSTACPS